MDCPRCRAPNGADARFCEDCGASLGDGCPQCGAPITAGKRFCRSCGAAQGAPLPDAFASPQAYTPRHLAERIIGSRAALEGERKQVSVLFADLKGSMELLADRDPEEARRLLDPVLTRMMDAVHHFDGTVNQVMGDGIMALFGAPLAQEDHAVRACYAALRMQEAVHRYAEEVRRDEGVLIQVRVGLNSGDVVVRSVGSDLRMDYTAVGQTTHLASRLEQLAAPGTTAMSAATLALAEGFVQVRGLGPMRIKGLESPVEVYELTGTGAARSRLQASALRGMTKFIARDAELKALERAFEQAGRGHGQVVGVVGEPGVGKSRLYYEFTHSHRMQGWLVLEAGSVSYGKANAYRPVIDLLKAYFDIGTRDDGRRIREKVAGKLLMLDRELEALLTPLLFLLDAPVEDLDWERLDPALRRKRIQVACKQLLFRESGVQGVVLVFEDLHWVDSESQALLDSVVDSLPGARILLLVNYRPEYRHEWAARGYYTQLRVDPLSADNAEALLESLLGQDASLGPLKQLLSERTEGNPLFLEECVRTLVETGDLIGSRGSYRLAAPLHAVQVPSTVQGILAARIDRLEPEDKRLLQAAAVVGKDVPFLLLQAVAGLPQEELRDRLTHLQNAELLYEASLYPELEHTFKHALTHEVAYGSVLQERRRALHGQIVEAIERLHATRLAEHVERLALHAQRAELWDKAYAYGRQAGERALARSANLAAIETMTLALEAGKHLPQTPQTLKQLIDLRLILELPFIATGQVERLLENIQEATRLSELLGDPVRRARAVAFLGEAYAQGGRLREALQHGREALAMAERIGTPQVTGVTALLLGISCNYCGYYQEGEELLERSARAVRAFVQPDPAEPLAPASPAKTYARYGYVWAHAHRAFSLAELGRFAEAGTAGEEAARTATLVGISYSLAGSSSFPAMGPLRRGNVDEAIPMFTRALETAARADLRLLVAQAAIGIGYAHGLAGRLDLGIDFLRQAIAHDQEVRSTMWIAVAHAHLGELLALKGDVEAAMSRAQRALELARAQGQPGSEAWAHYALGRVHQLARPCAPDAAQQELNEALRLTRELAMRPLEANALHRLGELFAELGEKAQARRALEEALRLYRELDMRLWRESAQSLLDGLT